MGQRSAIAREEVLAALEKALASPQFANSQRSQRFLRYVVEASLNNVDESLKEFAIAVDVFGRNSSYDPSVDATVRVEAGRLRSRLREYYAETGRNDPLVIEIPKGGYRANFIEQEVPRVEQAISTPGQKISASRSLVFLGIAGILLTSALEIWHLKSLPPPLRIASYQQITHDGHFKGVRGTDGSRLYIDFRSPNAMAVVGISGGEMVPFYATTPGTQFSIVGVSPDGFQLLLVSASPDTEVRTLWEQSTLGKATRQLAEAEWATFSPDGKSIVFSSSISKNIDVINSDGTGRRTLASPGRDAQWPSWSPDGKHISFQKEGKLWEMNADGSGLHELLSDWQVPGYLTGGQWSPDGGTYFFLSGAELHEGGQIWAIDERRRLPWQRSTQPFQLTGGPIRWYGAIPGKDGKTIFTVGETRRGELTKLDEKSGHLVPFLNGLSAEFISYSRDGKFIAYVSYPDGILWKANVNGSDSLQLSTPPMHPVNPRWSPDGSRIVFTDGFNPRKYVNYIVPSNGKTAPKKLRPESSELEGDPNWSADGTKIVFAEQGLTAEIEDLRILDMQSHQVSVLLGSTGMYSPRWSPDGRFILALSRVGPFLRVFDVTSQRWSVMPTTGIVAFPCFSSDSHTIYFLRYGVDQGLFRIRIPSGKEERVMDLRDVHLTGLAGMWLSLDPTDSPLLLRDAGTDDVYALTLRR